MITEEIVEEIDRLANELGLSRAKTIEHIFSMGLGLVKAIRVSKEDGENA